MNELKRQLDGESALALAEMTVDDAEVEEKSLDESTKCPEQWILGVMSVLGLDQLSVAAHSHIYIHISISADPVSVLPPPYVHRVLKRHRYFAPKIRG